MNSQRIRMVALLLAMGLSGADAAHAALQGRDLNSSAYSFEAYYDTVLDISWLADANYAQTSGYDADGKMIWTDANTWAANLSFTNGVNVYDDWRLPTVGPVNGMSYNDDFSYNGTTDRGYNITSPQNEMAHMFYVTLGNSGLYTPAGAESGCNVSSSNICLDNVGPFSNLQPFIYWSGTEYALDTATTAWDFHMDIGNQSADWKAYDLYVWAVSSGDVTAVPEAGTYAMLLLGLGLVSFAARHRATVKY